MEHYRYHFLVTVIFLLSITVTFSQQFLQQKEFEDVNSKNNFKKYIYKSDLVDVIIYVENNNGRVKENYPLYWVGSGVSFLFITKTKDIVQIKDFEISLNIENHIIIKDFKAFPESDLLLENYKKHTDFNNEIVYYAGNASVTFSATDPNDKSYATEIENNHDLYPLKSFKINKLVVVKQSSSSKNNQNNSSTQDQNNPNNSSSSQNQANQRADSANHALFQASAQVLTGLFSNAQFNNNKVTNKKTFFKMKVAIGNYNIPYYENTTTDIENYSNSTNLNAYYGEVGLPFCVYKNKSFYFLLEPYFATRVFGTASKYTEYGGTGRLSFGKKLSFFAEGEFNYKEGSYTSNITSNYNGSKINTEGTFGYNPIRFGAGIRIPFTKIDNPQDAYLELSYFKELLGTFTSNIDQQSNPGLTNYPADKADIFKVIILFGGGVFVEGEYSPKYPTIGDANFKIQEPVKISGNYYSIKVGLMFNL